MLDILLTTKSKPLFVEGRKIATVCHLEMTVERNLTRPFGPHVTRARFNLTSA